MKHIIIFVFILFHDQAIGQNITPSESIDGTYTTLIAEKGVGGKTNTMLVQLIINNGTIMLAAGACERCFPIIYTYDEDLSVQFKKPVFSNSTGILALTYDDDSFVFVVPALTAEDDFSYMNFYSKSASKVTTMTQAKIKSYAFKILDLL
ncbi:MAG: hypothetical protein WA775_05545 [Psychroserpens sp.]|uniref:hypothetical protein n=1 Tax=Psychroserpens sp. TaxID=2020870 RepID=UPI003CC130FE